MNWIENQDKDNELQYIVGTFKDFTFNKDSKTKIAGFDLDDTLIKPISYDQKFSTKSDDWMFYTKDVVKQLTDLDKEGFKIVIVTNQKGMSTGKIDKEVWKKKVENVCIKLNLPVLVLVSCKNDLYRKPVTTLWDLFVTGNTDVCKIHSFFCGDAGGVFVKRTFSAKVTYCLPKDFSDTDLKFALNLDIKFIHRDCFFLHMSNDNEHPMLNYNQIPKQVKLNSVTSIKDKTFVPNHQELIINVGFPASGKSSYTTHIINFNYVCISQDVLKTCVKCLRECELQLKLGKSVIIDNTSPSKEVRKKYIDIAKKLGVKCRCLLFTADKELSMHNNWYRHVSSAGNINLVPDIVYNIFKKKYEEPDVKEGFYKIDEIDFIFDNTYNIGNNIKKVKYIQYFT